MLQRDTLEMDDEITLDQAEDCIRNGNITHKNFIQYGSSYT